MRRAKIAKKRADAQTLKKANAEIGALLRFMLFPKWLIKPMLPKINIVCNIHVI